MDIPDLLIPEDQILPESDGAPVPEHEFMHVWEQRMNPSAFQLRKRADKNTLTDAIISPTHPSSFVFDTPIHIKLIGRHMNSSFRCHIGTGKASRPILSAELNHQMRMLAIFFRVDKVGLVSPDFLFFPTWLLHSYRYTQCGSTPGRTDVRFLRDASQAKEHHIYSLNHILNTMFRFNLHSFDTMKLRATVELANFLFDRIGIDHAQLPSPSLYMDLPVMYRRLGTVLNQDRPAKSKPLCCNCRTKTASRQKRCVACYRYQHKHGRERPLAYVVKNGRLPRTDPQSFGYASPSSPKFCANCGVGSTHQWYRNWCGDGNWCETCKSYYLRHKKVRPPSLYLKAAKRKVDTRSIANWAAEDFEEDTTIDLMRPEIAHHAPTPPFHSTVNTDNWVPSGCRPHLYHARNSSGSNTSNDDSPVRSPVTPPFLPTAEIVKTPEYGFSALPFSLSPTIFY
ncbi:hypothetical protein DFQ28_008125 [Apophysomyces sp. BC1034]|nr:hypothetical protein DFQ30_006919 [Apophysomyces sp. BC1015]KAG0181533.1 hypothetical protein DFQ29_008089 [Apophysomyces sp. BC1021]KAG0192735.1 hypothetical protein DFQ28_008125 [Apophysomyces sp. BC1034]